MSRSSLPVLLALASALNAAPTWTEYRMGSIRIVSDAADKQARERLNEIEQLRHALGIMLGKETFGLGGAAPSAFQTVWPLEMILFANAKEYGPHAIDKPIIEGGSSLLAAGAADSPIPRDFLRAFTRTLIEQNTQRMPDSIETALCDLFSTIKVTGTHVLIGAPLPDGELSPDRFRAWARLQLLATSPDYSGRLRVYLNNLQMGGDNTMAVRNAFDTTLSKLDTQVDEYIKAGKFEAAPVNGEAIAPAHDFIEKPVDKTAVDASFAELASKGEEFPPDSPRALVAKGNRDSLEAAMKANPRWGEPYFLLSTIEPNVTLRIKALKTATSLEPRNLEYWRALAQAQTDGHLYADADKSWSAAVRAAPNDAERARIDKIRLDFEAKRIELEAADKKRIADEEARDLQRVKDAAAAEVRAAEKAVNEKSGGLKSTQAPVAWFEDPPGEKLSGTLARVDCLGDGPIRIVVNIDGGGVIRLLIRDPKNLQTRGNDPVKFPCGVARQPRKIKVIYNVKADAKLQTVGDVAMVEFP
jgi:hypothetical protein